MDAPDDSIESPLIHAGGWVGSRRFPDYDYVSSEYFSSETAGGSITTSCPDWPAAIVKVVVRGTSTSTPLCNTKGGLYLNAKAIPAYGWNHTLTHLKPLIGAARRRSDP